MIANYYSWFKALHVIAVICWMSGLFYLPRLFAYHTKASKGSELDITFQAMERRLLKIIMNPAIIATYFFGIICACIYGFEALDTWFHIKAIAIIGLTAIHMMLAKWRKDFIAGSNNHSEKFYRFFNEIPVIFMIIAVCMVIIKPFE